MKIAGLLALLSLSLSTTSAWSETNDNSSVAARTFSHQLANGLKIIVREDHRAPVMVSQVWYRVGSSYEPQGLTGISHILEHMMFKGTEKVPSGEFSKLIAAYGGQENAFTSYDYTGYYQIMSSANLPLSLELEADRMQNALIPEEEFVKEIEVVKEERRFRVDDNPNAFTYERFMAVAYLAAGYKQPIIGWPEDINAITVADLNHWYQQWYAPNNATLVVVGDVNAAEVFELAARYFGPIPAKTIPKPPPNREPSNQGERRVQLSLPARLPALYVGYNVPGINTTSDIKDVYALRMLTGVLDGGYSARIETELVRDQQIATSAGAGYSGIALGDTLFYLSGIPTAEHTVAELEQAFDQQIKRLQTELAQPEELERVKAKVISSMVYRQDSLASQANQIGRFESIGRRWQEADEMLAHIKAITPQDIQRVARQYLTANNKTVAVLEPQPDKGF